VCNRHGAISFLAQSRSPDKESVIAVPRPLAAVFAAPLAGLALLAAGCGGSSPNGSAVANLGTTTVATTTAAASSSAPTTAQTKTDAAFAFSKCMRASGVPNFPDPQTSGGSTRLSIGPGSGIDPNTPTFQKAQTKCQKLLPNGGRPSQQDIQKAEQQALGFSKCMRANGVPNFPDPQFQTNGGALGIRLRVGGPGSGFDPNSPAFQKAQQTCGSLLPGGKKFTPPPSGSGAQSSGGPK
jgi:hypothetical protein